MYNRKDKQMKMTTRMQKLMGDLEKVIAPHYEWTAFSRAVMYHKSIHSAGPDLLLAATIYLIWYHGKDMDSVDLPTFIRQIVRFAGEQIVED